MDEIIKIKEKNLILIKKDLLGTEEAQVWIGPNPDGPSDNDDARVKKERAEAEKKKGDLEWRISGIEAMDIRESSEFSGWYAIKTDSWIPGVYRFMIHSKAGEQAPGGSKIEAYRDGEYSWPNIDPQKIVGLSLGQKNFLYLEKNKEGFCFRVEILEDREIRPAGDGLEWAGNWPEIKREVDAREQEKIKEMIDKKLSEKGIK